MQYRKILGGWRFKNGRPYDCFSVIVDNKIIGDFSHFPSGYQHNHSSTTFGSEAEAVRDLIIKEVPQSVLDQLMMNDVSQTKQEKNNES